MSNKYEIVYWELTRISRMVEADSLEQAIAVSESLRAKRDWSGCEEESEGTNGVERVYLDGEEVYTSGTVAGMIDPLEESS